MKKKYKNSLGFLNSEKGNVYTPDEMFQFKDGFYTSVRDMLWGLYENNSDEIEQRFISSIAPSWKILPGLTAKTRISTDYTTTKIETRNRSQFPAASRPSDDEVSGGYSVLNKSYRIVYGDIMLFFDRQLTEMVNLTANFGWQGRTEEMQATSVGTQRELAIDNVFQLSNSWRSTMSVSNDLDHRMSILKTAWVGSIGASYGDFVFLDITGRQEKSSTLPRNSRDYFYPSGSASFLYSEAFRDNLPAWYNYGKLRASYGIVGNAPEAYAANFAYDAKTDPGGFIYNRVPGGLGNSTLKPETTKEFEIGLESKFFKNRIGFEVSYYNRNISDMLFQVPLSASSGNDNIWVNSGTMVNKGVEFSINGTPVQTRDLEWTLRSNFGFNENYISELANGVPFISHGGFPNAGGVGGIRSYAGRSMGDFVGNTYKTVTDKSSPFYGERIVNPDGYYVIEFMSLIFCKIRACA